tara:strand:+ start:152 stop:679 length:528 start_codon:yes stop_codon:yes gene_type:complete
MAKENFKFSCYDHVGVMYNILPYNKLDTTCLNCMYGKKPETTLSFEKMDGFTNLKDVGLSKKDMIVNDNVYKVTIDRLDYKGDNPKQFASAKMLTNLNQDFFVFQEFFFDGYASHVFYKDLKIKLTSVTFVTKKNENPKLDISVYSQECKEIKEIKKEKLTPSVTPDNVNLEKLG